MTEPPRLPIYINFKKETCTNYLSFSRPVSLGWEGEWDWGKTHRSCKGIVSVGSLPILIVP